jgi:DNA-binding CsgD family transcriptional regulator
MTRLAQIAEWMAENGGTPSECARALGLRYGVVKSSWKDLRRKYGWQAQ